LIVENSEPLRELQKTLVLRLIRKEGFAQGEYQSKLIIANSIEEISDGFRSFFAEGFGIPKRLVLP